MEKDSTIRQLRRLTDAARHALDEGKLLRVLSELTAAVELLTEAIDDTNVLDPPVVAADGYRYEPSERRV